MCQTDAVGEGEALRARARKAKPDLAACLEVVDVVVERTGLASGNQLGDARELALAHRRFEVGSTCALGQSTPAAELGLEHVALSAQPGQFLFQGTHALPD